MEIRSIHEVCGIKPFIGFEVIVENKPLRIEGREWYCIDPSCNCKMANIMVHEVGGSRLTQLIYGWRPYKHYVKQHFFKSDCQSMVKGDLALPETKTKLNRVILDGFHQWLARDKKENDKIFAERYEQFRKKAVEIGAVKIDDSETTEDEIRAIMRSLNLSDIFEIAEKRRI